MRDRIDHCIDIDALGKPANSERPAVLAASAWALVPVRLVLEDWEARIVNRVACFRRGQLVDPVIENRSKVVDEVAHRWLNFRWDGLSQGDVPHPSKRLRLVLFGDEIGLAGNVIGDGLAHVLKVPFCPAELDLVGVAHGDIARTPFNGGNRKLSCRVI
jgi:hypothetical protein